MDVHMFLCTFKLFLIRFRNIQELMLDRLRSRETHLCDCSQTEYNLSGALKARALLPELPPTELA